MKSSLLFFGFSLTALNAFSQQAPDPILPQGRSNIFLQDSFYHWGWDTLSMNWNLMDRTLYTYDADQNVTSKIYIERDSMGQWVNQDRSIYTYDDQHQVLNELQQQWDGTEWKNNTQTVYSYDGNLDQISITYQNWNDPVWSNSFQLLFTYDGHHNILTRISQVWLGTDWSNGTRQVNTYDAGDHITLRLYQNWNVVWSDVARSIYKYDVNQDLDTLIYQRWMFNDWNDDYRNLYDFDAHHNRVYILEQLAVGINVWVDQDRYRYMFDQYDHITHLVYDSYLNNIWTNVYQYNIINDDDQNRATEVFQTWENDWVNADSTQYYYTGITAVHELWEQELITITPNPANDFIFVQYPQPVNGTVAIYSVQGTRLLQFKTRNENAFRINVASLLPGIYFVALQVGNHIQTRTFEKF